MTLTGKVFLAVAAFVLFLIAAIFLFFVHTITLNTDLGLIAIGLAAWVGSVIFP